ncbi:MAG: hypothetical protein IJB27_06035 [Clostridia bacterium]|nr:hypothetical protein [Clostridia bacterium]
MAWAGLVGDIVDVAVPCVSGVGEITRSAKIASNTLTTAADTVDGLADTTRAVTKTSNGVSSARRAAVRKAWKMEYNDVLSGGSGISRQWTDLEKAELLSRGKVSGYNGHHMYSVNKYPKLAGDPTNIQFLTRAEHLLAHEGNWKNVTSGRYVPSAYTKRY